MKAVILSVRDVEALSCERSHDLASPINASNVCIPKEVQRTAAAEKAITFTFPVPKYASVLPRRFF